MPEQRTIQDVYGECMRAIQTQLENAIEDFGVLEGGNGEYTPTFDASSIKTAADNLDALLVDMSRRAKLLAASQSWFMGMCVPPSEFLVGTMSLDDEMNMED